MSSFRRISLIAAGIILALCGIAASKPDTFRVERSISIKAPADRIFPLINDLHNFTRWSPYEGRDPAMQKSFSPLTTGRGASYAWAGNSEVGEGRMEIIGSTAPGRIIIQLDFSSPIEAHNMVEFALASAGADTRVTWAMEGPMPFVSKLMSIFFSMDAMVGNDFEAGLAKLKNLAEQSPTNPVKDQP